MAIVYLLTNIENGKRYVGKTKESLDKRWYAHVDSAKRGSKGALHRAIQKYGKHAFSREVLGEYATEEEALRGEVDWIAVLQTMGPSGYNMSEGGRGGSSGYRHTPEDIERRRVLATGRVFSEETRAKISDAQRAAHARNPRTHSPETRAKMSASHLAHWEGATPEERAKAPRERPAPERALRSRSLKETWAVRKAEGFVPSMLGKAHSDETKTQMVESARARWGIEAKCVDCGVAQTAENTSPTNKRSTGFRERCKVCRRAHEKR